MASITAASKAFAGVKTAIPAAHARPAAPATAPTAPTAGAARLSFRRNVAGVQVHARVASSRRSNNSCAFAVVATDEVVVQTEDMPNSHMKLKVIVSVEKVKECYSEVLGNYAAAVQIPGFKKGSKVPDAIVANYIGKDEVNAAVIEDVLTKVLPEAMAKVEDRTLAGSEMITTPIKSLVDKFTTKEPFCFDVECDVNPTVKFTADYKTLSVDVERASDDARDAEDVEKMILGKRKELGKMGVVADRGIEMGDVVVFSMGAKRTDNNEPVIAEDSKGFNLDTDEGDMFLPGLVDAILGWKTGEQGTFNLTFPDYWNPAGLRGVEAEFSVTIKEVFERKMPDLDDSLAASISPGAATVEEARATLLKGQQEASAVLTEQEVQAQLTRALAAVTDVDLPNYLVEEQGRQLYSAKLIEMVSKGQITQEMIPQLSQPSLVQNFMEKQEDEIIMMVKSALAVSEICKLEGCTASEEEMAQEVANVKAEFESYGQEFDLERVTEQAKEIIEGAKVLKILKESANVTYLAPTHKPKQTS